MISTPRITHMQQLPMPSLRHLKTVLIPVVGKQEHHSQNFVYVTELRFGMISFSVIRNVSSFFK